MLDISTLAKIGLTIFSVGGAATGGYAASIALNNGVNSKRIRREASLEKESPSTDKHHTDNSQDTNNEEVRKNILSSVLEVQEISDNEDDVLENDLTEEESKDISKLTVSAQYIQKDGGTNYEEERQWPSCKQWFKNKKSGKEMSSEECKQLVNQKWNQDGVIQPTIWISSDKDTVQKVLDEYGLLENSSLIGNNKWTVGTMICSKQENQESDGKLIVTCEYKVDDQLVSVETSNTVIHQQ
ncbi:hypothetical protein [Mycoplasma suis]|uniref:Uncharacterized protein n=2 Tax=Mycoplasma suis TaxID=57372 RepID=F0QQN4_MYCSL|nr:hypothetical protein [Mycoplasma suis]ADX97804.1 hypothetical protein MSU_0260 [Mycoplasma suis str. Illinois]CBZ40303.1 hypothetical protein MSUIS_02100 [Mycoplasma suis KI3806]